MARNYLKRELYVFPSDLQGRLVVMLSILRHEVNQILLAFCFDAPKKKTAYQSIAGKFRKLTGYRFNLASYLELLEKARLLDMSGFYYPGITYALTYAGYNFGRPLAAFTIRYSVDNDLSVGDFLGRENLKMGALVSERFFTLEKVVEYDEEARRFWQEWCLPVREFLRAPTQPPKEIENSLSYFEDPELKRADAKRLIELWKSKMQE